MIEYTRGVQVKIWAFMETVPKDISVKPTEAVRATPGDWQEIDEQMELLAGSGKPHGPRPQERMVFHWLNADD